MIARALGTGLAAVLLVTACASSEQVSRSDGYDARPIARYVLDGVSPGIWDQFYEWLGEPEYNEYFRSPLWPLGATLADCDTTWRIGVIVYLQRPTASTLQMTHYQPVPLKFEWTVPSRETGTRKLQDFHTSYSNYYIDGIRLDARKKIDGIYKVSVQHKGVELYQTSFELIGCEDGPYHPPWYEPMTDEPDPESASGRKLD